MAKVTATLWQDIIGHLRVKYPELVRGWFATLHPAQFDGGIMTIRARNPAQADYLRQNCMRAFSEATQAATGHLVTVDFDHQIGSPDPAFEEERALSFEREISLPLKQDFTFDNFVTGPCNRLAHAAAVAVSDQLGRAYNPFFVHGPVGLGKTHLLQAICHAVSAKDQTATITYISCETFTNHFLEAVENGALNQFRYRYRHADLLVIDDIQFLAERERSQEEFFHTFNTLHQSQKQIVLSADCSPAEIPSLEERLVSRFNSGLVAVMDRPCLETRMAIVRRKAKARGMEISEEIVRLITSSAESNIRELEGALAKIDVLSLAHGGQVTTEMAADALGLRPQKQLVTIPEILDLVGRRYNVRQSDLQGKRRNQSVARPRQMCMYLARQLTRLSLEEIGGYLGGRDHTTVLHAHKLVGDRMSKDPSFGAEIEEMQTELLRRNPRGTPNRSVAL